MDDTVMIRLSIDDLRSVLRFLGESRKSILADIRRVRSRRANHIESVACTVYADDCLDRLQSDYDTIDDLIGIFFQQSGITMDMLYASDE